MKQLGSDSDVEGEHTFITSNGFIIISTPHMHDYKITIGGIDEYGKNAMVSAFFNHPAGGFSPNGFTHTRGAIRNLILALQEDFKYITEADKEKYNNE